jgi:NAD(P)-dependent dehydrogenase (short-subunit alcohol dehydrogenase family)
VLGSIPRAIVDAHAEVNNFGTTWVLRAFAPLLRGNGRLVVVASSLGTLYYLAPVLHDRFDALASLEEADKQVATWRDAVRRFLRREPPGRAPDLS